MSRPTSLRLLQQLADVSILSPRATGPRGQHRWQADDIVQVLAEEP